MLHFSLWFTPRVHGDESDFKKLVKVWFLYEVISRSLSILVLPLLMYFIYFNDAGASSDIIIATGVAPLLLMLNLLSVQFISEISVVRLELESFVREEPTEQQKEITYTVERKRPFRKNKMCLTGSFSNKLDEPEKKYFKHKKALVRTLQDFQMMLFVLLLIIIFIRVFSGV